MTANEQELLSIEDKNRLLDTITPIANHPIYLLELINNTEAKIQTKLKAMGYEQVWTKCPGWQGEECWYDKELKRYVVIGWDSKETCPTCKGTGKITNKVEWDREKVARWLCSQYDTIEEFDRLGEHDQDDWLSVADQLHKKLTGGK